MKSSGWVAEREWLELTAELLAAPLVELPVEPIALQLTRTFGALGCSFSTRRGRGQLVNSIFPRSEDFGGHRAEIERLSREASRLHPILQYYRASGSDRLMQVADVPELLIGPGALPAWYSWARPWGCSDQLALPLRPGGRCAFVVGRDTPFGPAELELGARLWRLLVGLDRQVQAFRERLPAPEVAQDLRLTPREVTVLGLLAEGLTAGAIGRRLAIGERTVHKHLEHAYGKLGVRDRLAAVLRAQHLGLVA